MTYYIWPFPTAQGIEIRDRYSETPVQYVATVAEALAAVDKLHNSWPWPE